MSKKRKISHNCERATFLIEKKQVGALSIGENLELTIHLAGCTLCRIFQKQSKLIDKMALTLLTNPPDKKVRLEDPFKDQLQKTIDSTLGKNNL